MDLVEAGRTGEALAVFVEGEEERRRLGENIDELVRREDALRLGGLDAI